MKTLLKFLAAALLLVTTGTVSAQSIPAHDCPSDHITDSLIEHNPQFARSFFNMERVLRERENQPTEQRTNDLYTLPVVVHVIHLGEAYGQGSNITDEQIYSAIEALNEDFRHMPGTNGYGAGPDINIEFCLASRNPQGNPTTGINRINGSTVTDYATEGITVYGTLGADAAAVKGLSTWPGSSYVNIWIVSEIENNDGGSGVQGFATFPTTAATDGIVLLFNAFGTTGNLKSYTNMGRVFTHEMGHYLGLYHTFHETNSCTETDCVNQGDHVCDTPATMVSSSCTTFACPGQQVENYMDYTPQTCQDMFTEGQKLRMRTTLETQRASLLNSLGCMPVFTLDAGITNITAPSGTSCNTTYTPQVALTNFGSTTLTSASILYNIDGVGSSTFNWTGSLASGMTATVSLPSITAAMGSHTFYAWTGSINGSSDQNASNNQHTSSFTVTTGSTTTLTVVLDYFGAETSWQITDSNNAVMDFGGPYVNNQQGLNIVETTCLPNGCYTLIFQDAYGDGQGFTNGSFTLRDQNNTILATASGNWGAVRSTPFCLDLAPPACTAPVASFTRSDDIICTNGTVSFTNTSTNTPTSYAWSFPGGSPVSSTSATPGNITYAAAGTYDVTLTATNAFGSHTYTCSGCVTVITGPTVSLSSSNPSCFNTNTGSITSTVTGGYSPYVYLWSNNSTTANLNNVAAGAYSVTVTNAQGCGRSANATLTAPTQIAITGNVIAPSCNSANDGSISVSVTGGTGNKTYLWSNGATTANITGLDGGTFTVTVTDANGCQRNQAFTVTEPSAVQATVVDNDIACGMTAGNASINAAGGTAPYTYEWSTGASTSSISNLAVGNYTATVSDNNGCSVEVTFAITQQAGLNVTATAQAVSCNGLNNGSATASISGGVTPYTITWSNGATGATASNLAPGTYTVNVSDANGCSGNASVTITQPAPLTLAIFKTDITCFGMSDGTANASFNGGTAPLNISWSNGASTASITDLSSAAYTATVTDANGCTATENIIIVEPSMLTLNTFVLTPEGCNGNDGSAVVNIMGGTGDVAIVWSTGATTTVLDNVAAGIYSVDATDSNGCTLSTEIEIPYDCAVIIPTTQLIDSDCGASALSAQSVIACEAVADAEMYQWRFTSVAGQVLAQEYSLGNQFMIGQATALEPGTTLRVAVRVLYNSAWGPYGSDCVISLDDVLPTTSLNDISCGATFNSLDTTLYVSPVQGANTYEWHIVGTTTSYDWTTYTVEPELTLASTMQLVMGESYEVAVRCNMGAGISTDWGASCSISFEEIVSVEATDMQETTLLVYPNPCNGDIIQLQFGNLSGVSDVKHVVVYSASGSLVENIKLTLTPGTDSTVEHRFDHPLASGVYFLKYVTIGQEREEKFIVR